jgi:sulfopyruvate decarboxylase subunit alpha
VLQYRLPTYTAQQFSVKHTASLPRLEYLLRLAAPRFTDVQANSRCGAERRQMPVSLTSSTLIHEALKECDVRLVSALPETWLVHLIRLADDDPEMTLVRLAKEEEGVGISAGAHFAGVKSAMLMQNHGFLASINGIVSFAHLYKIPLLMLISYRGSLGERDPWQTQGGNVTEPLLRALGIPYFFLDAAQTAKKRIRQAQTLADSSLQPVALLLTRDLMWEE